MPVASRYSFDNAWQRAAQRLRALELWLDPGSERHLDARGIGPGWHCLEIGAGGGSIAAWMADRVAPGGRVVATDIDTRHARAGAHARVDIIEHDIVNHELPAAAFDLIHTRLVLAHVTDPERALGRIYAALKPGGWFVAEEMDFSAMSAEASTEPHAQHVFDRLVEGHHRVTRGRGFRLQFGRGLFGLLRSSGLVECGAEGREFVCTTGSPGAVAWQLTFEQLGGEMLALGAVDDHELAAGIALADDPSFAFRSQLTVAAWGRRPFSDA